MYIVGNMWSLISSLHQDVKSAVKWHGQISEKFRVEQGLCQGGIHVQSLQRYSS